MHFVCDDNIEPSYLNITVNSVLLSNCLCIIHNINTKVSGLGCVTFIANITFIEDIYSFAVNTINIVIE